MADEVTRIEVCSLTFERLQHESIMLGQLRLGYDHLERDLRQLSRKLYESETEREKQDRYIQKLHLRIIELERDKS